MPVAENLFSKSLVHSSIHEKKPLILVHLTYTVAIINKFISLWFSAAVFAQAALARPRALHGDLQEVCGERVEGKVF